MAEPHESPRVQADIEVEDDPDRPHQPTSSLSPDQVSFYEGARDAEVHGGRFTAVAGSVFYPGAYGSTGPVQRPQQQQRQNTSISFFKDTTGAKVIGGDYTSVGGDVHGSPPPKLARPGGRRFSFLMGLPHGADIVEAGGRTLNNLAATASSSHSPSPGSSRVDSGTGTKIDPSQSSVGETSVNPSTPSRLESAVAPFKNSLDDKADREIFTLRRPHKTNALYKIMQIEIRYGVDGGVPYSVLAFRLEQGEDEKKCLAVKLKGEFIRGGSYQDVSVKEIRCVPEDTQDTLIKGPVQQTSTNTGQIMGGITAGKPTFQATLTHMKSVQTTLIRGQSSESRFDDARGTFEVSLGVDAQMKKELSVVNNARFAVLLRLKEDRQPMKLKLTLELTYCPKFGWKDKTISECFTADYAGTKFYDIVKGGRS